MVIAVAPNGNYGNLVGNQKYSPLTLTPNTTYAAANRDADAPIYSGLLVNRRQLLADRGMLAGPLSLAVADWPTCIAAEGGHNPPLVVISSNRSAWIARGIANGQLKASTLADGEFTGVTDFRALDLADLRRNNAPVTVSPPIYAPERLGPAANRNVYVVVHMIEYKTYQEALEPLGITVVGFNFKKPGNDSKVRVSGFGASRYAAISFCKELRAQVMQAGAEHWDYAWLLDDNVVALTAFPGLAVVEAALTAANVAAVAARREPNVAAGFEGGTAAAAFNAIAALGRQQVGVAPPALAAPNQVPGILQQAVLWNIDFMSVHNLNFGFGYVTSGEDVSFGNHCISNRANAERAPIPYLWYGGISVRKELAFDDGTAASTSFAEMRRDLVRSIVKAESRTPDPVVAAPPPVMVQAEGQAAKTVQALVIHDVLSQQQAQNLDTRKKASSQAVEQLTCGALGRTEFYYVSDAARAATFSTAGNNAIAIERRSVP